MNLFKFLKKLFKICRMTEEIIEPRRLTTWDSEEFTRQMANNGLLRCRSVTW